MGMTPVPEHRVAPDQAARDRIRSDLGATLFVEAGAGSGKTTALVDRIVELVAKNEAELRSIAAITFTDKAADELRDRTRREIERRAEQARGTVEADRCRVALDQLDGAAIGTLHSFARRLLTEYPLEAGLPPQVDVLDEVSSAVASEQRWSAFQDRLLADPALARPLLALFECGVKPEALRALAAAFEDNWDLVEERVPQEAPEPPLVKDLLGPAIARAREVCAEPCRDATDRLRARLDEIAAHMDKLASISDELELLEALAPGARPERPSFNVGNLGQKRAWNDILNLRQRVREAGEGLDGLWPQMAEACARKVATVLRRFTLEAAAGRRAAGELAFHDLLVLARALLRRPDVRRSLHQRYQRLLLDEFQDTDPIQVELAVRIAAAHPESERAGTARWDEVEVAPGHLFVVGDPKQSIYRFRRADISTFLSAARLFGAAGGRVELTANFRTVEPVIVWVNRTFGALMSEPPEVSLPVASQPDYIDLAPTRAGAEVGPAVSVLGRHPHPWEAKADELRTAEAAEVAATVVRAVGEGWQVHDGLGGWRPARLGDVTILVPARTSLPFLEDALDEAGIAFRAEASSLVYASRAVRDLFMLLRAVDDPTNRLATVSALRTPLLACGDDDLFRFRAERGGHFNYLVAQPASVPPDDPVRTGLEYLRSLHDLRHWLAPSELLDRVARDRRGFELGFAEGRPRDVWRRLRFVIDQARAWHGAIGGNLRQYLAWVGRQTAEGARVAEAVLPESDDDAVRIMTIHAAKGLEFPITIVSGLSTAPGGRPAPAEVVFRPDGYVGYYFGPDVATIEYQAWVPIDEQMNLHERARLLYVACTRAQDHLVVSLHRRERKSRPQAAKRTNAELLVDGMGLALGELPDGFLVAAAAEVAPGALAPPAPLPPFATWEAERGAALAYSSRPRVVAATALSDEGRSDVDVEPDPGLEKRPRNLDLPPWLKGRYGTAVGRAVHGVLQTVDLATGAGLADAVAAQCEAEAVLERTEAVQRLVVFALGSPSVQEAARCPHWRELYVCTPVGGRLLEGYIDLLYRGNEGLVVVDHKTAAIFDVAALDGRVAAYRNQGASYALAVAGATGEPVVRVTFLFLTPVGAFERHLEDLEGAVAHVRDLVASGHEVLSP
jgi:ATP-dependent exoDNAse (exonuclease V) beta subunit